ncbi:14957_t:CDS:2, partial [Gigaspora margarita]
VPKVAAAFPRIEIENWTRQIDENYIYKQMTIKITTKKIRMTNNKLKLGRPNPYYDNINTIAIDNDSIKQHAREKQNINNREYMSIAECIKRLQARHNIQMEYINDIKINRDLKINLTTKIDPQYILQNQLVDLSNKLLKPVHTMEGYTKIYLIGYPEKYSNYLYQRCAEEEEDFAHVLSCKKNKKTIEDIINEVWLKYCNEKKIQRKDSNTKGLCTTIRKLNIKEKLFFGVITEEMLVPSNNRKESIKQTTIVLHQVTIEI